MKDPVIVINASHVLDSMRLESEMNHRAWGFNCRTIRASYKQKTSRMRKGDNEYVYTKWYREKPGGSLECVGDKEPDWKKLLPPEPVPKQVPATVYEKHLVMSGADYEVHRKLFRDCLAFPLSDCMNLKHPLYKNPEKALKDATKSADSVREGRVLPGGSQISGGTETRVTIECNHKHCMRYVWPGGDSTGWGMVDGKWYCSSHYPLHSPTFFKHCDPAKCQDDRECDTCRFNDEIIAPVETEKDSVRSPGVSSGKISDQRRTEKEDMCRGDGDCDNCEHQDECPVIAEDV